MIVFSYIIQTRADFTISLLAASTDWHGRIRESCIAYETF